MNLKEYIELNGEREIVDIETLEKCLTKPKPKTIYDIKKGDPYFILNIDGYILSGVWGDRESEKAYRSMGFAFLTEEEAEIRKKMLLIEEEFIKHGGRREFRKNKCNHYISFSEPNELILYNSCYAYIDNEIYFDTEEQLKKAVEQIGKQRIIDEYYKPRIIAAEDQE